MIRRAKPLLGTIVAIAADAAPAVVDGAFAAVERIHARMSAQRTDSDIGRINREAHRHPVPVDPWTIEVLAQASRVSEATGGIFDVVLPGTGASYADIELENHTVCLRRRARLDVSGIAKGFAVDLAVDLLQQGGARLGSVNAGGDLRFFGAAAAQPPVNVRVPHGALLRLPPVSHRAYATSSGEFGAILYDPRNGSSGTFDCSVTVAAATCLVADALTKAIALLGPIPALLKAFDAVAFAIDDDGRLHAATG